MTKTQSLYTTYGSIVFVIYNVKPEIINNSIQTKQQFEERGEASPEAPAAVDEDEQDMEL